MSQPPNYYKVTEFARRFRLSRSYVYQLIESHKLRSVKIGTVIRIPRSEYCRFCAGSEECAGCTARKA